MFQLCCRICLQQKDFPELRSLFDTYKGFVLRDALLELFQIKVQQTDMLSTICKPCVSKLCTAREIRHQFLEQNQKYRQMTSTEGSASTVVHLENSPQSSTANDDCSLPAVESTTKGYLQPVCATETINTDAGNPSEGEVEDACYDEEVVYMLERIEPLDEQDTRGSNYELKLISDSPQEESNENFEIVEYVFDESGECATNENGSAGRQMETAESLEAANSDCSLFSIRHVTSPKEEETAENISGGLIGEHECNQCSAMFKSQDLLNEHTVLCTSSCSIKAKPVSQASGEEPTAEPLGKRKIRTRQEKPYRCTTCGVTLHNSRRFTHRCPKRQASSSNDGFEPRSEQASSAEEMPRPVFGCQICDKVFEEQSLAFEHGRLEHGLCFEESSSEEEFPEPVFGCHMCYKTFEKQSLLLEHGKQKHGAEFEETLKVLEDTPIKKRGGKGSFRCRFCPKTFIGSNILEGHENMHTKRQSFCCSVCGRSFGQYTSMRRHMKIHNEIKAHQCDICHARFRQRTVMLTHRRRHTGEKPYQCDLCSKSFRDHSTFSKHRRVHQFKPIVLRENNEEGVNVQKKDDCDIE